MSLLKVLQFGEESLQKPSLEIDKKEIKSKIFRRLVKDMLETMYAFDGVGLAAPQIGVNKRLIVIDTEWPNKDAKPLVLINPKIVYKEGEIKSEEGCLSFKGDGMKESGVNFKEIRRFRKVKVNYTDLNNKKQNIEADGDLLSRCLQHEIDHLDGILFIDRVENIEEVRKELNEKGFSSALEKNKSITIQL